MLEWYAIDSTSSLLSQPTHGGVTGVCYPNTRTHASLSTRHRVQRPALPPARPPPAARRPPPAARERGLTGLATVLAESGLDTIGKVTDGWQIASTSAGAGAAVAAAWASWSAVRATRQTAQLVAIEQERRTEERRDRDAAASRAQQANLLLRASKNHRSPSHETYLLTVHNTGPATAIDVTLGILPAKPGDSPPYLQRTNTAPFVLVAQDSREVGFAAATQTTPEFVCRLQWTDGAGPHVQERPMVVPTT